MVRYECEKSALWGLEGAGGEGLAGGRGCREGLGLYGERLWKLHEQERKVHMPFGSFLIVGTTRLVI